MKKITFLLALFLTAFVTHAQVGINDDSGTDDFETTAVDSNAVLELRSSSRGLLLPRLTTTAILEMSGVTPGTMVYDTTVNCFKGWNGTVWHAIGAPCEEGPNTPPVASNVTISGDVNVGQTVTAAYDFTDADGDTESGSTYQWYFDYDGTGIITDLISESQTYTIESNYETMYIYVCVTPNDGEDAGERECSDLVQVGPFLPPSSRINEIDYDNVGTDTAEFIEVRVDSGTDVSNMAVITYPNGSADITTELSTITPTSDGNYDYYVINYAENSLQNGGSDAVALVDGTTVIEFLSYEGVATASNGPASGMSSIDIGVADNNADNVSPQRSDDGLTWYLSAPTEGAANAYVQLDTTINFVGSAATVNEGDGTTTLTIELSNPEPSTATTADLVLTSGEAADLGGYTTQTITFPAGDDTNQTVTITISEDADDINEDYVFALQNVAGGSNATAVVPATYTLTVRDNDAVLPTPALVITGVFDGPLSGGTPKGVELYVTEDIPDLSIYGIGSANNGEGSDNEEYTFPTGTATAGDYIYVATEATEFANFFGFAPDFTDNAVNINGDDAIELFQSGVAYDVFGDITYTAGDPIAWKYTDGWAYANDCRAASTTFTASDWTYSGTNALDEETTNATATTPVPVGTYACGSTPTTDTTIQFSASNAVVSEADGTTTLTVEITNPEATTATTAEVALTSGDAADLGGYTTQTVTFAAGSSSNETITITISDDADQITEDYVFTIQNVSGGSNASAGTPSTFTLTVTDDDAPTPTSCKTDLLFTEYYDGTNSNKYIEIYNGTGATVNLTPYKVLLYSNGNTSVTSTLDLTGSLADDTTYVVGNSQGTDYSGSDTTSGVAGFNGDDILVLTKSDVVIDRIGPAGNANNNNFVGENAVLLRNADAQPNATYTPAEWTETATLSDNTLGSYTCTGGGTPTGPTVGFASATLSYDETAEAGTVNINYTNDSGSAITANISVANAALSFIHNGTVSIPTGTGTVTYDFIWGDNATADGDVTVTLTIDADPAYTVVSNNSVAITITDDESPTPPANLVQNPGFETGDTTSWTKAESATITTTGVHSGGNAVEVVATSTKDLAQDIAIEGGETYTISFWYKITQEGSNSGNSSRIWSDFEVNTVPQNSDLKPSTYLPTNGGAWSQFTVNFTAPANETGLHLEVRTYSGATVVYDDFSVVKQ